MCLDCGGRMDFRPHTPKPPPPTYPPGHLEMGHCFMFFWLQGLWGLTFGRCAGSCLYLLIIFPLFNADFPYYTQIFVMNASPRFTTPVNDRRLGSRGNVRVENMGGVQLFASDADDDNASSRRRTNTNKVCICGSEQCARRSKGLLG